MKQESEYKAKSVNELMKIRFLRNKMGVVSSIILVIIFLLVIFAKFVSPYSVDEENSDYIYAPPQKIHFFHNGKLMRPFIYKLTQEMDPETFRLNYAEDKSTPVPIHFLTEGSEYNLFGIFKTKLHLFQFGDGEDGFLLGADRLGRDLLSRILYGMRVSLTIPLLGMIISVSFGSIIGIISGYIGGITDMVIQRIIEFLMSFPRIPLWLTISAALPPTWSSIKVFVGIAVILAFLSWVGLARQVRAKVLAMRESEFILAARAVGGDTKQIVLKHLLPTCYSHIIVVATLIIPTFILAESSLSFLGLGIKPPMTSLGVLLREAQRVDIIVSHPWLLIPGIVIVISILCFNFLGDAVRDAVDPLQT